MGIYGIALAIFLFIFLVVMTLIINPPEKWVRKLTGEDEADKTRQ